MGLWEYIMGNGPVARTVKCAIQAVMIVTTIAIVVYWCLMILGFFISATQGPEYLNQKPKCDCSCTIPLKGK